MTSANLPYEVQATTSIHGALLSAARAAVELAQDKVSFAACQELEGRRRLTIGVEANFEFHNHAIRMLGESVKAVNRQEFVSLIHPQSGVVLRLGSCDSIGRPRKGEHSDNSPYAQFKGGEFLYDECSLRPVFVGYSLDRGGQEVDRLIISRFSGEEHLWSYGIDPALGGTSASHDQYGFPQTIPIPIELQRKLG